MPFFISIFILNKISKLVFLLFLFNRVQPPLASGISPVTSVPIPGKFQDIRQKNWPPGPQGLASTTPNHAIPLYPPLSISLPSSFYPPLSLPLYFSISNPVQFHAFGADEQWPLDSPQPLTRQTFCLVLCSFSF